MSSNVETCYIFYRDFTYYSKLAATDFFNFTVYEVRYQTAKSHLGSIGPLSRQRFKSQLGNSY